MGNPQLGEVLIREVPSDLLDLALRIDQNAGVSDARLSRDEIDSAFSARDQFAPGDQAGLWRLRALRQSTPSAGLVIPAPSATTLPAIDVRPANVHYKADAVLLFGDSQSAATGPALRHLLRRTGNSAAPRLDGRSGHSTRSFIDHPPSNVKLGAPDEERLIVIQLGGNDISSGRSAEHIIANLRRIIRDIHRRNPSARVVVSTIPVRWEWAEAHRTAAQARRLQANLDAINRWIQRGGDPTTTPRGVAFGAFDANAIVGVCDAPTAEAHGLTCHDGAYRNLQAPHLRRRRPDVHLNGAGYDRMAEALAQRYIAP